MQPHHKGPPPVGALIANTHPRGTLSLIEVAPEASSLSHFESRYRCHAGQLWGLGVGASGCNSSSIALH